MVIIKKKFKKSLFKPEETIVGSFRGGRPLGRGSLRSRRKRNEGTEERYPPSVLGGAQGWRGRGRGAETPLPSLWGRGLRDTRLLLPLGGIRGSAAPLPPPQYGQAAQSHSLTGFPTSRGNGRRWEGSVGGVKGVAGISCTISPGAGFHGCGEKK